MSENAAWTTAFARQAHADFATWSALQSNEEIPECHRLLFLQMACEKLTKAHLCGSGANPADLQSSHAYTAKNLPIIIRQQVALSRNRKRSSWIISHTKHLAREIELLAPAVREGDVRPDNCEYPWEDQSGAVHSPLDWSFTPSRLLTAPAGRTFLKLVREAIGRFL